MSDCASVSSVDASQLSHASQVLVSGPARRFVGADGGVASVVVGVVIESTLLSATLPERSRAVTLNTWVLPGARSKTTFVASRAAPSTYSVYQTWLLVSSVEAVQAR